MYAIYLSAPAVLRRWFRIAPAWMNVTFNRDRRAFMAAVDGKGEFAFHTQLRDGEDESASRAADALAMFQAAVGARDRRDDPLSGHMDGRSRARRRALPARADLPRRRCGASVHPGRRARLQHRGRGRGQPRLEAGGRDQGRRRPAAARELRAGAQARRRPQHRLRAGVRRVARAVSCPATGSKTRGRSESSCAARPGDYLERHGRAEFNIPGITFGDPLQRLADHHLRRLARRPDSRTATSPAHRRAGARPTCGSERIDRSTTPSASSGRCCDSGRRRRTATASWPRAAGPRSQGRRRAIQGGT